MNIPSTVTRYFHPVLAAGELRREPVRVQLAGQPFVLFRDRTGRAGALRDRCPHRAAPLSRGTVNASGQLVCAYHGWRFDTDGHGASPSQPALTKCDAGAMRLVGKHGAFWLADRDAAPDAIPSLGLDGFTDTGHFAMRFAAPLHVAFDNFCEDEHTPWVHTRLGWRDDDASRITFSSEHFDDRTEVRYAAPQRPSHILETLLLEPGDVFENTWVTRVDPPRSTYTIGWRSGRTGEPYPFRVRATVFFVPEGEHTTVLQTFTAFEITSRALRYRALEPVLRRIVKPLVWLEFRDDARFVKHLADTPFSFRGMRLGKYDAPLVHNHRLLERIYFASEKAHDPLP